MLIMGCDEVYPLANAQTYRNQLFQNLIGGPSQTPMEKE